MGGGGAWRHSRTFCPLAKLTVSSSILAVELRECERRNLVGRKQMTDLEYSTHRFPI